MQVAHQKIQSDELFSFARAKSIMGIPALYDGIRFDNSSTMAGIKRAIEQGRSIYLSGSPGSGKTHYAVLAAWHWCRRNLSPAVYVTETGSRYVDMKNYAERERSVFMPKFLATCDFYLELKDTFHSKISEADVIAKYANTPLLILDDFGADKTSEYGRSMMYALIDRRYRTKQPVVFTSNLSLDDIAKTIDDRIASRIIGMCSLEHLYHLGGTDHRLGGR